MRPTTTTRTKKATIRKRTEIGLTVGSVMADTRVSTTMPIMSSMMAAPRMAVPTLPLSRPISRRVSTVMETEVAVSTTPTKTALSRCSGSDGSGKKPR